MQSAQWLLYLLTLYTYPGWLLNDFVHLTGVYWTQLSVPRTSYAHNQIMQITDMHLSRVASDWKSLDSNGTALSLCSEVNYALIQWSRLYCNLTYSHASCHRPKLSWVTADRSLAVANRQIWIMLPATLLLVNNFLHFWFSRGYSNSWLRAFWCCL